MRRILCALLAACAVAPCKAAPMPPASGPELVIFDNDWCELVPLTPLLANPRVRVLGVTTVTGDCWSPEATAAALADLETLGRSDIPVLAGAVFPLVNTPARLAAWEAVNGSLPWKGAWNSPDAKGRYHPDEPFRLALGAPKAAKAGPETAAAFMVRQVRAHPHQVTIYAAGPMTNIALALRLDPEFARLAKQFVFDGGHIRAFDASGESDADFNPAFDPEAAKIAFTAAWPRVISIGDLADSVVMTPALRQRLNAKRTTLSAYIDRKVEDGMPIWDTIGAAIIADPSLITASAELKMDVDLAPGLYYGRVKVWTPGRKASLDARPVTVIQAIDRDRYLDGLVAAAQGPAR
jgi:inosine-uridine nucleoside N-ribohydrolase